mmetsp:Transcript_7543/g.16405  ORF Transcript_7543/g.16405 Transcript_7543/m.16405 type:complete len:255 (-) Transcript_7543:77-841(-)
MTETAGTEMVGLTGKSTSTMSVKNASTDVRMGFVRKVYGILSAELLLTVLIAAPICKMGQDAKDIDQWAADNSWMLYMSMAGLMATMCSMFCCMGALRTYPTNYIFLVVITGCISVLVGFSSALYTWQSVVLASGLTVAIFLAMTAYAWNSKTDFTGYGPYLFGALCSMMIFGFALMIMGACGVSIQWGMMLYDFFGVLLFTFYIVFDTQLILGEYGGHKNQFSIDDYVFAALNLYLDIINLFLHILALLGERR